jgi:acetyl esterase/lipase
VATIHRYGSDPSQYAELYEPTGERRPGVVVVIHGGFWRAAWDADGGRALSMDLAGRGWVAWNIEYRRVGNGGGWPATLEDVAAAIDRLAERDVDVDTSRVLAVGHSAGGHLATWAAGRALLPVDAPGADPAISVTGVIAQAGVLDLRTAALTGVGGTATPDLLGGLPDEMPDRYAVADPMRHVPLPVPVVCVHGRIDDSVPFRQSETYVAAARAAGADVDLLEVAGDHMSHRDPTSPAWAAALTALTRM